MFVFMICLRPYSITTRIKTICTFNIVFRCPSLRPYSITTRIKT